MENSKVLDVVEETVERTAVLNKPAIIGALVAGGLVIVLLVPKAVKKAKQLWAKRKARKAAVLPAVEEKEITE